MNTFAMTFARRQKFFGTGKCSNFEQFQEKSYDKVKNNEIIMHSRKICHRNDIFIINRKHMQTVWKNSGIIKKLEMLQFVYGMCVCV